MIFISIFAFVAFTFLLAKYAINHKNFMTQVFQKSEENINKQD